MRILIGVQGTGNGHLSRCAALAEALALQQVEVDFLMSGRPRDGFFDMELFGSWQWRQGLTFAVEHGRVALRETVRRNHWRQFWQDVNELDLSSYDLVVSDYEPVTAWAARKQQRRIIGIGRQYAFYKPCHGLPISAAQRQLLRWFAPVTDAVGMHWSCGGSHILPPVIHQRGPQLQREENHYLVYLPFEPLPRINRLLQQLTDYRFSVFHPAVSQQQIGAVSYYPPSRNGFAEAFSRACGVISNAGFETSCEALWHGKKLLVRPLAGQFEQLANARCLEQLQLASVMRDLDSAELSSWIEHGKARQCWWPDVATELAQWLADGAERPVSELSKALWRKTDTADYRELLQRG